MKEKILLADDEESLSRAVGKILEYNNYEVDIVSNGKEAIEKTKNNIYDIIILDIMMPIMDGIEALKEMRKNGINTPIMLLTAKSLIDDKVKGLDAGANDYLTKPFNKKELLARIRNLTRKSEVANKKYIYGNITINFENSEISTPKASLFLNNNECEIMKVLVKNQEKTLNEYELKKVIGLDDKDNHNIIPMYISFLQEKFNVLGANIVIDNANGYMLKKLL